jgi:hypothetical protein
MELLHVKVAVGVRDNAVMLDYQYGYEGMHAAAQCSNQYMQTRSSLN